MGRKKKKKKKKKRFYLRGSLRTPFRLRDDIPGTHTPGLNGTIFYRMWSPREGFARERDFTFITRPRDSSLISTAAVWPIRRLHTPQITNLRYSRPSWGFVVGSCGCPQEKCKRSVRGSLFRLFFFERDVFVRERDK